MSATSATFTTPVGRFVQGSMHQARDKDMQGNPLTIKTGKNKGQPTIQYYFAIAIPKSAADSGAWWNTEWGKQILAVGAATMPQAYQRPDFAWKVTDGDSAVPNKMNKKPCDTEGFQGHWIIRCTSQFAPQCYDANGLAAVPPESIKCGYYIQAQITCDGNDNIQNPGVYMNGIMVALAGYGPEIHQGPDVASAGFGKGVTLPAGASTVPVSGFIPPAIAGAPIPPVQAAQSALPVAQSVPAGTPGSAPYVPSPIGTAPVASPSSAPVPPNPAFTQIPVPPVAVPQMTAKAGGATHQSFVAQGWTDAQMREQGYMV